MLDKSVPCNIKRRPSTEYYRIVSTGKENIVMVGYLLNIK